MNFISIPTVKHIIPITYKYFINGVLNISIIILTSKNTTYFFKFKFGLDRNFRKHLMQDFHFVCPNSYDFFYAGVYFLLNFRMYESCLSFFLRAFSQAIQEQCLQIALKHKPLHLLQFIARITHTKKLNHLFFFRIKSHSIVLKQKVNGRCILMQSYI